MSMEQALEALLQVRCPRVYQVIAPPRSVRPYVTWQPIGGKTLRAVENTPLDKRNTLMQINAWADKSSDARDLIRQIEDDLCASAAFVVEPQGEAMADYEEDTKLYGALQRFSIYAART
jgi:hypothetical protein